MSKTQTAVALDGRDSALVAAALFAIELWPFESPAARTLAKTARKSDVKRVSKNVWARWMARLDEAGLGRVSPWTREVVAKRAALNPGIVLSAAELPIVILALDVVTLEFTDNWHDFCIAIPGWMDWYGVVPADVDPLARRLESALSP